MNTIQELHLVGSLRDFTPAQQRQMGRYVSYYQERDGHCGPGVVRSAQLIVDRANQGSIWPVAKAAIDGLLDKRTGLRGGLPLDAEHVDEKVANRLCTLGTFRLLDECFFVYLDGSITVGYDNTGFVVAEDDNATIMHPETRYAFQLPESGYDMTYGQKGVLSGRTLFFYRLVQACKAILEAEGATAP